MTVLGSNSFSGSHFVSRLPGEGNGVLLTSRSPEQLLPVPPLTGRSTLLGLFHAMPRIGPFEQSMATVLMQSSRYNVKFTYSPTKRHDPQPSLSRLSWAISRLARTAVTPTPLQREETSDGCWRSAMGKQRAARAGSADRYTSLTRRWGSWERPQWLSTND